MNFRRAAYVARTAHDQTHGNKLVVPEYGVIEIRLKKGSKESKSYLPTSSLPRRKPATTGDDTFNFAPGTQWKDDASWAEDASKTDKVKVLYHLYNPFSVITEAKLELFRRFDKKVLWERKLEKDELLDGEHELEFDPKGDGNKVKEWDGALGKESDEFPDGFVTTEHSPYKLRLTVKGEGVCQSPAAWTFFHILIEKLELEWGPDQAVTTDVAKRKPFKDLKAAYADPKARSEGTPARIYLVSNVFKTSSGEMFNNTLFTQYQTLWGDGPEIAVFAKVYVKDSGGAAVLAAEALGKTKFLWDWESKLPDSTNTFINDAQDYDKDVTKPKGQNCHKDRGGKRGDDTKQVFPAKAGYDAADTLTDGTFPFKVEKVDDPRKWAAYSIAWRKGKLAAKTGVLFQPSRMAGDMYKLTVHAAHEITDDKRKPRLNVDADAPLKIDDKLKAESGIWQVWRKLYFRRYMTKSGATTTGWAGVKAYFEKAFMDIEDKSGGVSNYPSADWNSNFTTVHGGWNDTQKLYVNTSANQYTAGNHGIQFRTRAQFSAAMDAPYGAYFNTYPGGKTKWMEDNGYDTSAKYAAKCQGLALNALITIFDAKMPADEGISLFQVEYSMNPALINAMGSFTDGLAADFPSGGRHKCAFLWTAPSSLYGAAQGPAATPAHEIGHHLMLPHPRNTAENTAPSGDPNNDYDAHDRAVTNCLMSYLNAARELCGMCQLRQRGWDKSQLDPDGANKKP